MKRTTTCMSMSLVLSLGLLLVLLWLLGGEIGISEAAIRDVEPAGFASPTVYSDTATFTTQAHAPPEISVSPGVLTSTQYVNQVVTKPLIISNGSGVTLTFNLTGADVGDTVLLMHLDESAGATIFYDSSGNDNHGSCSGASCPTAGASGKFGQALSFDGVDDYVEVSNSCDLGGSSFAVGAWIYRESGTERKFISKWNDNTNDKQFDFQVYSDSKLWFEVRQANSANSVARGTTTIEADQWYYVTAVADTQTQELNLYVNGVEETLQGNPGWDGTIISVNMELNVGRKATGNHHWYGLIDEVVIYDRALSTEEVEALYLNGPYGSDVPWLSKDPISGTVTSHSSTQVQVTFDATGVQPGDYTAEIVVRSNDPVTPSISIPVTMTVLPTANMGRVGGTVTDAATGAPLTATIVALSQPYTVTTNPDTGYYKLWLDEGSYTVQVAAAGYVSETAVVSITAQQGITQDFGLVPLNVPVLEVAPASLAVTHYVGDITTRVLTITNDGPAELTFNLASVDVGDTVLLMHFDEPAGATTFYDASGNDSHGSCSGASCPTAGGSGKFGQALSFDGNDDYVEVPDDAGFDFGTRDFTISAWIKADATTTVGNGRDDILAKGDPTISGFAISTRLNRAAFWVGPSGECFGGSVLNDREWHHIVGTRDSSNNIVLYVDSVSECTGINSENVDTGYSLFIGKHGTKNVAYFDGLIDEVVIYDRALSAEEVEALYLNGQYGSNVPWLSKDPISGMVTTNSSTQVQITFDATGLQPDTYTAEIVIQSNDPVTPSVSIPVTMTVLPTADMGRVTGTVSDAQTALPLTATVELVGVYSMLASPDYTIWAPAGTYSLTAYASDYVTTTRSITITAGGLLTENLILKPVQHIYLPVAMRSFVPRILIAIAGERSDDLYSLLSGDSELSNYTFTIVGNDWTYSTIQSYDGVIVNECDACLTANATTALRQFYDSGKPVILGMEDVDEQGSVQQADVYYIFGVTNAEDGHFDVGTLNITHPIAQGVTLSDLGSEDHDHFDTNGAVWVVQGSDGNYYVLAYNGQARSVIFGENLHNWWEAGNEQLIRNAIDWVVAGSGF